MRDYEPRYRDCMVCGAPFEVVTKRGNDLYCSDKCRRTAWNVRAKYAKRMRAKKDRLSNYTEETWERMRRRATRSVG